jgi:hypothetical protein
VSSLSGWGTLNREETSLVWLEDLKQGGNQSEISLAKKVLKVE